MLKSLNHKLAIVSVAASVLMGATAAHAADKLTFVRSSPWGLDSAQLTFGQQLGFFSEEGIEVEYVVAQGSLAAVQQVLGGSGDVTYLSPEVIALSYQADKTPLPMLLVYNYYRRFIWEVVVLNDSPIHEFADLKGKTIGVGALTSGNVPITTAAFAAIGVGSSDFSYLPVGFGAQAFQALTSKAVDALNLFHTMHETLAVSGVPIRRISYPGTLANVPSASIAFTQKFVLEKPEIVERFGRAMTKSTVACAANREACVRSLWTAYPELKPATPEGEAMAKALPIVDVNLANMLSFAEGSEHKLGMFVKQNVIDLFEAAKVGGLIQNTDVPLDKVYTNRFVDAYNDFDREKLEAAARTAN